MRVSKRSTWRSWLVWFAVSGASLLLLGIGTVVTRQVQAAIEVRRELAEIRQAGQPIDDASMAVWYQQKTHQEGTAIWNQILHLAPQSASNYPDLDLLPLLGIAELPETIEPQQTWRQREVVEEFLEYCQPILVLIVQAEAYPRPVWHPVAFSGFETSLSELHASRSVIRLLQLEVEAALWSADAERALRGLRGMRITLEAFGFDSPIMLVADLVNQAIEGVRLATIQRCLQCDLWTERQLAKLRSEIGPAWELEQRWQHVFRGERSMGLISSEQAIQGRWAEELPPLFMLRLPTTKRALLAWYRECEQLASTDPLELLEKARVFDDRFRDGQQGSFTERSVALFVPAVKSYASAFVRSEDLRRMTLAAVAVKQFQVQEGRWPGQLSELVKVGLGVADWSIVAGIPLGYQDGGDEASLWGYDLTNYGSTKPSIPAERPDPEALNESGRSGSFHIAIIR